MWECGGWGVWEVGWVSEGGEGGGMPIKTFRGFRTERARLGNFNQNFKIFTQNEHVPAQRFFF